MYRLKHILFVTLTLLSAIVFAGKNEEPADTLPLDSLKTFLGIDVISVNVEKVSGFESAEFSFGIHYRNGEIYYASLIGNAFSKAQLESNEYFKFLNEKAQVDVFHASETGNGAQLLAKSISTDHSEGAVSISPDGNEMLFTRAEVKEGKMRYYISYASKTDSGWVENKFNGFSSNVANFAYPCWDASGTRAYFSCDRQGGEGGMDIYYAEKRKFGWSAPKTLGKGINSPGNELYPQIMMDTVLFFATDGRSDFGGLDLVYTGIGSNYPVLNNLMEPINSTDDDVQIVFVQDTIGKDSLLTGYLISNRKASKDELYSFSIQLGTKKEEIVPDSIITVEADFLLDDRLTEYASEILSELQQGLRDIYGSLMSKNIGPVSDGTDGLEKGKRLIRLSSTVEESFEQEVQFLMANAIENLLKKQEMLESLENESLADISNTETEKSLVTIDVSGPLGRDVGKLMEAYADQLIRDHAIPATVAINKHANGTDYSITLETSASARDKERVAEQIRNVLSELEANNNYSVSYGNGISSASELPTDYIFSGNMKMQVGRAGEKPESDVQVVMLDIDDSVDVLIQVLDAEDVYAGRKLKPSQQIKLKLPSMDFAVDAVIADVGSVAQYTKGASGYSSITLYDKSYEETNTANYSSSTLYTIQLASLKEIASTDFFKGLIVNEYKCSDGFYRYTTGIARSVPGAQRLLTQVKNAGFEEAFVIEVNMIEKRLEKMYSIIVASGAEQVPAYKFPAGWKVAEYKGKTDDLYRYAVGEFEKIESALAELNRIKKVGYKGAFIENNRRFTYQRLLHGAGK